MPRRQNQKLNPPIYCITTRQLQYSTYYYYPNLRVSCCYAVNGYTHRITTTSSLKVAASANRAFKSPHE